jgi:nicotinate phosphoribosyltransferase
MLSMVFDGSQSPPIVKTSTLTEARARCMAHLERKRPDHTRVMNPTPYKVSVTPFLYDYMQKIWMEEAPVAELV